ncbi:hypothetical protein, partial [Kineosporia sp. A_224]|uniref:hypothetical protein n=1 Tax=Kineosporia sp. A_224 TaxID=1962180 RepID=UPI00117BA56A
MAPEGSPGADRPADDVMAVVRDSVAALDRSAPGFRPRCYAELIALVPGILGSTADHGRAVTEELTTQVFAAALSEDTDGVVADRLGRVGAQLYAAGFPVDGYQGAAHAVLRAARDVYPDDWDSTLSSAWVAYLGWAGDRLSRGAAAERARG